MRVLLAAMPDTTSALDAIVRFPNLGLCSIAGNLEGCEVKVLDLAFHSRGIGGYLREVLEEYRPDLVGLSAMSFQYESASRVARICRSLLPEVRVALGGYHATLMHEEIAAAPEAPLFDFLVRGEGEWTFRQLIPALAGRGGFEEIAGLSFRDGGTFRHNPPAEPVDLETLQLPDRDGRLLDRGSFLDLRFDCAETSRGCTMGCRFCSITRMYGQAVRYFPLERVIKDLQQLKGRGTEGVFFVDDNITLDVPRLRELCRRIIAEGLNSLSFVIQASVRGIASDPELAAQLRAAGFRWVFLGIESGIARNLAGMGKAGVLRDTRSAVEALRGQGICVFGGFIVGNPGDSRDDVRETYRYALQLGVDHPIVQCLTPYPKTQTREQLLARGLVSNPDDLSRYNGFICNVRTEHLSSRELTRAMLWNGLRLYFHPRYLLNSRFWRFSPRLWLPLLANNFRYLLGAARGRLFASRHTW